MRTFAWWFGMGCLTTLSVLMIQGGIHDILYPAQPEGSSNAAATIGLTILGGGLLAGCLALILNRLR